MIYFENLLKTWGSDDFRTLLKQVLEGMSSEQLPLQQGLKISSYVSDTPFSAMILSEREQAESICIKVGVFYTGVIAGCNCADDPTPVDEQNEYCELQLEIDKQTAAGCFTLIE